MEKRDQLLQYIEKHKALPSDIKDLSGLDLEGLDLEGVDFSKANLDACDLRNAKLKGCIFFKASLKGGLLDGADISGADFTGADLTGVQMENVIGHGAGFGAARLEKARLFKADLHGSVFTKAMLDGADLRCADFTSARLREANLKRADFTEAILQYADLSLSNVARARFDNADLRYTRLRAIKGFERASWIGSDIRDINFAGAYLLRRFIMDQNYLKEFKEQGFFKKMVYYVWLVTSNCGRSMTLWMMWTTGLTAFFAWLYTLVGVDFGRYPTMLSPLYYSIVTLTTLGYGDVVPKTLPAQLVAMAEVMAGYMMLGGLLSIFATKMARRSE